MKKHTLTAVHLSIGLILSGLSSNVFADDFYGGMPRFYVGFGAGVGSGLSSSTMNNVLQALVQTNGGTAQGSTNSTVGFGRIFLGYKINPELDIETGVFGTGNVNTNFTGTGQGGYSGTDTQSFGGIDLSMLLRLPYQTHLNGLFLRLGVNSTTVNETQVLGNNFGGSSLSIQNTGTGYQWGVGYDLWFSPAANARIEFISYPDLLGMAGNPLNVISLGLMYHF
jgi:hypothetical protein